MKVRSAKLTIAISILLIEPRVLGEDAKSIRDLVLAEMPEIQSVKNFDELSEVLQQNIIKLSPKTLNSLLSYCEKDFSEKISSLNKPELIFKNKQKFLFRKELWGGIKYDFEKDLFSAVVDKQSQELKTQAPIGVYWLLNGPCNLKCIHCYGNVEEFPRESLSESDQMIVAQRIIDSGAMRVTLAGGEVLKLTQKTEYKISGLKGLEYNEWYTVISNHQSWADIFVLQKVFNHRIPFLKFFLKKDLIWVPFIGICWWALDFPFMRRYSKAFLQKYPQYKGKDLEITKKSCLKFKFTPVSVMNFLEGTRFQPSKHKSQNSPYKFLLKPKSGGMAYALNVMGDKIKSMVDVTIYYQDLPGNEISFWNFMSGKIKKIYIHTQIREIPEELKQGDYENDPVFRAKFQNWINQIWLEKDQLLEKFQQESMNEQFS